MSNLLQADIFFFVTTLAVAVFIALGAVLLYYCIKIARDIKHISEKLKRGSDEVASDLAVLHKALHEKARAVSALVSYVGSIASVKSKVKKHKNDQSKTKES